MTFTSTARTRKRCPHCGKIIEVGERCVVYNFKRHRWGWQAGGFIGESSHPRTHLYHPSCAEIAPELQELRG